MGGDKELDIECGTNAGVKLSVLVRTGYGIEHETKLKQTHKHYTVVDTLGDFTDLVLGQSN